MRSFRSILVVIAASASALAAKQLSISSQAPRPGHTGAFGEPDCRTCHSDYPLNEPGATIRLDSLPEMYEPERAYALQLALRHAQLKRAGFQLTARFEDGSPAGRLEIGDTTLLRLQQSKGIGYLSHSGAGSNLVQGDSIVWRFKWVAPASDRRVVFSIAANVANHDASEFGDRIFTRAFHSGGDRVKK